MIVTNSMLDKSIIPEGTINGLFSINQWQRVLFSKGNLQYQASTRVWRFADCQYDYLGSENCLNNSMSDLFASPKRLGYHSIIEWGDNPIINGGFRKRLWRTLTWEEWRYVFYNRNTKSGLRFAKAEVNETNGVILFPDDWEDDLFEINQANIPQASFNCNVVAGGMWSLMEGSGAVFLPAAGYRGGGSFIGFGLGGYYWSASPIRDDCAFALRFDNTNLLMDIVRYQGVSVRLVYANY